MFKYSLIIQAFFVFVLGTNAQTFTHDFQQEFSYGTNQLIGNVMNSTADGGFIIVSSVQTTSGTLAQDDIILLKLNSNYDVIFQKRYDISAIGGQNFYALDVIERQNGGYAVCGFLASTVEATTGGFLLQVKSNGTIESFKFYPTDPNLPETIARIDKVMESNSGYVMIGTGINQTSETRGVIMSASSDGSILWAKHVYSQQYIEGGRYNENSLLYDLAKGKKNEFVAVGSVNGAPSPDSDILVVKFNEDGDITGNWVFERQGKVFGDGQQAFLDKGTTVTYNPAKNCILVAGISLQADESDCSVADIRHLLTFELDNATGTMNWSKTHDFDPTHFPDNAFHPFDIVLNSSLNEYAICGYRSSTIFNPGGLQNLNGFVVRLNVDGSLKDTRIYGESTNDFFYSIEEGTTINGYTVCGNKEGNGWLVESLEKIIEQCNQAELSPATMAYPLQFMYGFNKSFTINHKDIPIDQLIAGIKLDVICEKSPRSDVSDPSISEPGFRSPFSQTTNLSESFIYPTLATDYINISNSEEFIRYKIYDLHGKEKMVSSDLIDGLNRIDLEDLQKGVYLIQLSDRNGYSKVLKFSIQ